MFVWYLVAVFINLWSFFARNALFKEYSFNLVFFFFDNIYVQGCCNTRNNFKLTSEKGIESSLSIMRKSFWFMLPEPWVFFRSCFPSSPTPIPPPLPLVLIYITITTKKVFFSTHFSLSSFFWFMLPGSRVFYPLISPSSPLFLHPFFFANYFVLAELQITYQMTSLEYSIR